MNKQIFETIYYGAMEASCEIAAKEGPYSTYEGSPVSKGIFQYDMWNVTPTDLWDWAALKAKVAKHGIRNSLLLAPMPTASTAQIMGNNEGIEPYTSNIYARRVLSGEFQVVNHHLLQVQNKIPKIFVTDYILNPDLGPLTNEGHSIQDQLTRNGVH